MNREERSTELTNLKGRRTKSSLKNQEERRTVPLFNNQKGGQRVSL